MEENLDAVIDVFIELIQALSKLCKYSNEDIAL